MKNINKNKECVLKFYQYISGIRKTEAMLSTYTNDPQLIKHLLYMDSLIPCFSILVDEITAEEARVFVRARCHGLQQGTINGNPPTYQYVEFPLAIGYTLNNGRIIDHWVITDQISLFQQLGIDGE